MDGFLRFYKQFPRFILSFLFVFIVFCTVTRRFVFSSSLYGKLWGIINLSEVRAPSNGFAQYINTGNSFVTGFILFFACIIASTIGTIFLHLIAESTMQFLTDVLRIRTMICRGRKCTISFDTYPDVFKRAILPYECLAMHFFYKNKDTIFYYLLKKSLAQKEIVSTYKYFYPKYKKDITLYFKDLELKLFHLFFDSPSLHKFELVRHYDYFSNVSQEQLKRDSIRGDVDNIHYFIAVCFVAALNAVLFSNNLWYSVTACVVFSIIVLMAFVTIGTKRWFLASYMLYGFLDVFLIGESASVTDRDSA